MKCFYCDQEIDTAIGEKTTIALDNPYANLPFHRKTCMQEVETIGLKKYLNDNLDKIYKFSSKWDEKGKKRK